MKNDNFQVLLFYKYVQVTDPEELKNKQKDLCKSLNLKGRIIVANEGINGTLEGTVENCGKYIEELRRDPRFKNINFKKSIGTGTAFPKLSVKARKEIVAARLVDINPNEVTGKYLTADELHQW